MDKILVEVYVEPTGDCYDIFLPAESVKEEVELLIKEAVYALSDSKDWRLKTLVLCDRQTDQPLDNGKTVTEIGLQNGSELLLTERKRLWEKQ